MGYDEPKTPSVQAAVQERIFGEDGEAMESSQGRKGPICSGSSQKGNEAEEVTKRRYG